MDVSGMEMGQEVILEPFNGQVIDAKTNKVIQVKKRQFCFTEERNRWEN